MIRTFLTIYLDLPTVSRLYYNKDCLVCNLGNEMLLFFRTLQLDLSEHFIRWTIRQEKSHFSIPVLLASEDLMTLSPSIVPQRSHAETRHHFSHLVDALLHLAFATQLACPPFFLCLLSTSNMSNPSFPGTNGPHATKTKKEETINR